MQKRTFFSNTSQHPTPTSSQLIISTINYAAYSRDKKPVNYTPQHVVVVTETKSKETERVYQRHARSAEPVYMMMKQSALISPLHTRMHERDSSSLSLPQSPRGALVCISTLSHPRDSLSLPPRFLIQTIDCIDRRDASERIGRRRVRDLG